MSRRPDPPWWSELPAGRVSHLAVDPRLVELALDPLPADAPAVLRYRPAGGLQPADQVDRLLDEAERAAAAILAHWLPGTTALDPASPRAVDAVRTLAGRLAARSPGFGPFLADLAAHGLALAGVGPAGHHRVARRRLSRFPAEVRAAGVTRVLADAYRRREVALLVEVPDVLAPADEYALTAAVEWFAQHGRCAIWLVGAAPQVVERIRTVPIVLPAAVARLTADAPAPEPDLRPPVVTRLAPGPAFGVPPLTGVPRADSPAEQALERALARCDWAYGRRWNHTLVWHTLARPCRLDLFWAREGLVVEVDGPEHRGRLAYADDRRRDAQLQLLGHDVLRFTNEQVLADPQVVVETIRELLLRRRAAGAHGEETNDRVDR